MSDKIKEKSVSLKPKAIEKFDNLSSALKKNLQRRKKAQKEKEEKEK